MALTPKQLGERIDEALRAGSIPRERAALEIGKSRDSVDRYITGKGDISAIEVWKISQLTGVPFGWFAGDEEIPIPEELDAVLVGRLLDALEQRTRATESTIGQLRALLLKQA